MNSFGSVIKQQRHIENSHAVESRRRAEFERTWTTDDHDETVYRCPFCKDKKYTHHEDCNRHIHDFHPQCPSCGKYFHNEHDRSALEQRAVHQLQQKHCYCKVHDLVFSSLREQGNYLREVRHDYYMNNDHEARPETAATGSVTAILGAAGEDRASIVGKIEEDDVSDDEGGVALAPDVCDIKGHSGDDPGHTRVAGTVWVEWEW
ncbi:hypothetical protein LTR37_014848 [Vermiconidia calcicola]|uniref:Uncharacterized protein n=1 Tax=Vermiconidia calcicola TaxID=1690605 RepID=A0ACC3MSB9_9PEZI|nr:hypothetical protein LTR37_014848 [Vermiconidia calcicola]